MKILLTNDDGINARGIRALVHELNSLAEIYVVAPDQERSGTGHSITFYEPIKVRPASIPGARAGWAVSGTPVDCVKLGIAKLVEEDIDLVISGINHGPNLGTDVLYSGTVSAAAEGIIMGYPSLAVSLAANSEDMTFDYGAVFTRRIVKAITEIGLGKETLLNINVPWLAPDKINGLRITQLGVRNYDNLFDERRDPRGNTYYWLGGGVAKAEQNPDSDVIAVQEGFISITPIRLDLTDYRLIDEFRQSLVKRPDLFPKENNACSQSDI